MDPKPEGKSQNILHTFEHYENSTRFRMEHTFFSLQGMLYCIFFED